MNLVALIEQWLGSNEVATRLGALVGLSPESTRTAIRAAVPAILAALVSQAQRPAGRDQLAAAVRNQDPGVLDTLSATLSGGRERSLVDSGSSVLTSLLGGSKVDGLSGAIARFAGLNQGSATSLLGALAPVVLGALGREQRAQGLDAQGLANLLNDQKGNIAQALPAGLTSELGSTGLLDGITDRLGEGVSTTARAARAEAARTASVATPTTAGSTYAPATARQSTSGGGSWLRWLLGLLLLALLAWLAWQYLLRDRVEEEAVAPTTPPATVGEPAQNLVVDDVNIGQEVTNVFENATAALNGVTDAASAEAALPKLNEIGANLDRLGGLAGRLPAEGQSALAAVINGALPELEALIARVSDLPGVGDIIRPVANGLVEKLKAMAA
ncbi:MAG TPA: DUF937 domain-containing protein [Geminicoccaceae bacterium]|nr:DUF937 domain-containing protein [Geminicoccaceae bacterium]